MSRNSISALNELSQTKGVQINYDIRNIGTIEVPRFSCLCTYGRIFCTSQGSSKKIAKELCANDVLLKLRETGCASMTNVSVAASITPTENYVGKLNEYCSQHALTYPDYFDDFDLHQSEYTVRCKLSDLECKGASTNKKYAKQISAMKMLQNLTEQRKRPVPVNHQIYSNKNEECIIKKFHEVRLRETRVVEVEGKILSKEKLTEYNVSVLQSDPLVLAATHKKDDKTCYIATGSSSEEAIQELQRQICMES